MINYDSSHDESNFTYTHIPRTKLRNVQSNRYKKITICLRVLILLMILWFFTFLHYLATISEVQHAFAHYWVGSQCTTNSLPQLDSHTSEL